MSNGGLDWDSLEAIGCIEETLPDTELARNVDRVAAQEEIHHRMRQARVVHDGQGGPLLILQYARRHSCITIDCTVHY